MRDRAPSPHAESDRLARLRQLAAAGTGAEPAFEHLVRMAAQACATGAAALCLIDAEQLRLLAGVGLPELPSVRRDAALCERLLHGDDLVVVPDAAMEPRLADHPWVAGGAGMRFVAAAALVLADGHRAGALCVADRHPGSLTSAQADLLQSLAALAARTLEMRRDLVARELRYRSIVEDQTELISLARPDGTLVYVNPAYARAFGGDPAHFVGADLFDYVEPSDHGAVRAQFNAVLAHGRSRSGENRMVAADGSERWVAWTNTLQHDVDGHPLLHSVGRDVTERRVLQERLTHGEWFLRQVTDRVPVSLAYVDRERRFRFINEAQCRRFGLTRDAILGRRWDELQPARDAASARQALDAALGGQGRQIELEEPGDAGPRRIECRLVPDVDDAANVRGVFCTGTDVTERSAAEHELRALSTLFRSVVEAIPAFVAVVGADERIRLVNRAFERWAGRSRFDLVGSTAQAVLGSQAYEKSRPWIRRALAGESVSFERDAWSPAGLTHLVVSYVPLYRDDGGVDGFVSLAQDITDRKREEVRLFQLTQRDALTGLLNRAGFEARLDDLLREGDGSQTALLYVDLDRFKPVNDTHGHPVGDELLRRFADRLRSLVRPSDAIARLGGDEFAIVLSGLREAPHARAVAGKIVAAAAEPFDIDGVAIRVGASVGVAIGADAETGWGELVARADAMLYRAKEEGRGRLAGPAAASR